MNPDYFSDDWDEEDDWDEKETCGCGYQAEMGTLIDLFATAEEKRDYLRRFQKAKTFNEIAEIINEMDVIYVLSD